MNRPAPFDSNVGVACLPEQTTEVPVGSECMITGWGKIEGELALTVFSIPPALLLDELFLNSLVIFLYQFIFVNFATMWKFPQLLNEDEEHNFF